MKTFEIGKSMFYGIAIKSGFKLLEGVTSVDKIERVIKERKEEDVKIFLEKNFKYSLVIKLIMKKIKIKNIIIVCYIISIYLKYFQICS